MRSVLNCHTLRGCGGDFILSRGGNYNFFYMSFGQVLKKFRVNASFIDTLKHISLATEKIRLAILTVMGSL